MKIAIIGVGAMGCLLAAYLEPLTEVVMLGHWQAQLTALQDQGLVLIHPDGRTTHHPVRVCHSDDAAAVRPVDLALILVKSRQTAVAAGVATQVLATAGLAITLQNGLGNLERLAAVLGDERAVQGVTSQGATLLKPGMVQHAGHGPTYLATTPATAEQIAAIAALFCQAGLETSLVESVDSLIWGKLAVSSGINPLTALLRVPNGFLAENETARQIMSQAAEETATIARALGIQLPYADAAQQALAVAQATANNYSSMLQDVLRGAPTEIEAICGAVVAYGRRVNVPTPLNELLLRQVQAVEAGRHTWPVDTPPEVILETLRLL